MKPAQRWRLWILVTVGAGLIGLWRWVAMPFVVVGDSMAPTLHDWDLCLMRRTHPYEPRRGDIVVFRTADAPPLYFIKRVIALPGETIACAAGQMTIDGHPLPEPYTAANGEWELPPTKVPPDQIFVIGDNRRYLPEETVHGLVAVRLVQSRLLGHWRWRP